MTDLEHHIQTTPLVDTHNHLRKEADYLQNGPDVLQDLFDNYVTADLAVAGASPEAIQRLLDPTDPDLTARFTGVREAWERCRHTGYGEAVRLIARQAYGMEEITAEGLEAAKERNQAFRQPGQRLRILQEEARLHHVQIDDFVWACLPDESGPDFFLYDLSWVGFCSGEVDTAALYKEVGVEVNSLASLQQAMEALFAKYGPCAIAVKSQHAYNRTLQWREREAGEVEGVLQKRLKGEKPTEEERLCLGDWCWARGLELAIEHNLPFKHHTGYYAGHSSMVTERIRPGHLCPLLIKYPGARFVLMHYSYPYQDELVALAKHFPNVYADLCWGWSIDPASAADFVRRMIHAVPASKLFGFGGDTGWPNAAWAYATQARRWLNVALQAEVDEGLLTEREAIRLASRFMHENQEAAFDLEGTRAAIHAAL